MRKKEFAISRLIALVIALVPMLAMALVMLTTSCTALELSMKDQGESVTIKPGEPVTLSLEGNPTTGFLWELAAIDRSILSPDGEPVFVPDSERTGSGGKVQFRFIPQKPGTTPLRLVYRRPWENNVPPSKTFEITVTVKGEVKNVAKAVYVSTTGKKMTAIFDLAANNVTVTLPDGGTVTLPEAMSASGARYGDGKVTFWEHQGTAVFLKGEEVVFEGRTLEDR